MLRFNLRALIGLTTLVAILLAARQYKTHVRKQVVVQHYEAMKRGFQAIECHRPNGDKVWLANFKKTRYSSQHHYRDWLSGINLDRRALTESYILWERSIHHASLRDYYRRRELEPWNFFAKLPVLKRLPKLPDSDSKLKDWWFANIEPFVRSEELNTEFFTTSEKEETMAFNCKVINYALANGGKPAVRKWLALRNIVGPKR